MWWHGRGENTLLLSTYDLQGMGELAQQHKHERAGPAPHRMQCLGEQALILTLGSTLELTLFVGLQVIWFCGHESRCPLPCMPCVVRGREIYPPSLPLANCDR